MEYSDGTIYDGFWKQNQREGQGKITHTNGDVYEGMWVNG